MKSKVKKRNYGLWLFCWSIWLLLSFPVSSQEQTQSNSLPAHRGATRKNVPPRLPQSGTELKSSCSEQTIETLTTQLLRDLPNYANRVSQRDRRFSRATDVYSYMLVAGKPEFAPLPLNPGGFSSDVSKNNSVASEKVEQVFFTTLERLYVKRKAVQLQQFHWLFLTKTKSGWRLVTMYSQIGHYPANEPPTPPRESSNGVIAQAVNTWLRDCQAGSVRF